VGFAHQNVEADMHKLLFVLIAILAMPLMAEDKNIGEKNIFEEKGKFSVEAPESGYEWKKWQDINSPLVKGTAYKCKKKDSKKFAMLVVCYDSAKTEKEKRGYIKGFFLAIQNNPTVLKIKTLEEMPEPQSKIGEQISFPLNIQSPDAKELKAQATTDFRKNTYFLMTIAENADDAKEFNDKILKSLKEFDK
jgi:hypothetical protein